MAKRDEVLQQLIAMTRRLAEPERDLVILAEGNTSARIDETFWMKASGVGMRDIDADGFVEMRFDRVLAMLEGSELSDEEVQQRLAEAKIDPQVSARPSVETVLHALALTLGEAQFVGHTHPTVVNAILCSQAAEEAIAGRLFPDEIVVCGPAPAYVPYTDPGVPLACRVRQVLLRYHDEYGEPPKVILMQNHGLIALGGSADEVDNVTAMYVKTARVILGTYGLGGPHFMSHEAVMRIHTRPDELYRRLKAAERSGES
jgi:rhamnose utilization protein RhaD (predicted bifunctional aldolase and dehydrogenase)